MSHRLPTNHRLEVRLVKRLPGFTLDVEWTAGEEALECLVLYAPPLGPHGFVEVPRR